MNKLQINLINLTILQFKNSILDLMKFFKILIIIFKKKIFKIRQIINLTNFNKIFNSKMRLYKIKQLKINYNRKFKNKRRKRIKAALNF